jgi:uncharacterized protein YoxC
MKALMQVIVEPDLSPALLLAQEYGPGALAFIILLIAIIRQGHKTELGLEKLDRKIDILRFDTGLGFQKNRNEMSMGFEKADRKLENEIKNLRNETQQNFKDVRNEIKDFRNETQLSFKDIRNEIKDVRIEIKDLRIETLQGFKDIRTEMKEGFTKKDYELEKINGTLKATKEQGEEGKVKIQTSSKS